MFHPAKKNRTTKNQSKDFCALWHVDDEAGLFIGPLGRNKRHSHAVPVFLSGIYETISIRVGDANWNTCRAAIIPAGVSYEFSAHGAPLAVFYLEPTVANVESLYPFISNTEEQGGALIGATTDNAIMRELFEDHESAAWASVATRELISFALKHSDQTMEPRIKTTLEEIQRNYIHLTPVSTLAQSVGLSPSRFQHLFSKTVGVPFRRYRTWQRMRGALREISSGSNFTNAAHAAGFSDQSHFNRDFSKLFGARPTEGLRLRPPTAYR